MTTHYLEDGTIIRASSAEEVEGRVEAMRSLASKGLISVHPSWLGGDPEEDRMRDLAMEKYAKGWRRDSSTESQKSQEKNSSEGPKGPTSDE